MSSISVIVPVYNVEKFLRASLDSVVNQTFKDIEVICIDDGSTDGSLAIMREYARKDPRVKVLEQENSGAGAARNRGLMEADGKYVYFCDPDDVMNPELLWKCFDMAEKTGADVVTFRYEAFDDATGAVTMRSVYPESVRKRLAAGERVLMPRSLSREIFTFAGYSPWNKLFRREFIQRHGFLFQCTRRTNDAYFVMMALTHAKGVGLVDEVLYRYRRGVDSAATMRDDLCGSFVPAFTQIRDALVRDGYFEEFRSAFVNAVVASLTFNLESVKKEDAFIRNYAEIRRGVMQLVTVDEVAKCVANEKFKKIFLVMAGSESPTAVMMALILNYRQRIENLQKTMTQRHDDAMRDKNREAAANQENIRELQRVYVRTVQSEKALRNEVFGLKASTAYRVGMFVTWPARRVYRMLKCWRENGFKYTIRRLILGKGRGRK